MHGHPGMKFSQNRWEAMTFRAGIYKAPLPCPFPIRGAFSFDIPIADCAAACEPMPHRQLLPIRSLSSTSRCTGIQVQVCQGHFGFDLAHRAPGPGAEPQQEPPQAACMCLGAKRLDTYDTCDQRKLRNQGDKSTSVHRCIGISQHSDIYISVYRHIKIKDLVF